MSAEIISFCPEEKERKFWETFERLKENCLDEGTAANVALGLVVEMFRVQKASL